MARRKIKFVEPMPTAKSCGKNRYISEQQARIAAEQQELLNANSGLKLKTYHCSFCGGWHLTRQI